MNWDLIVVGAGPAGSTAARVAAEAGARVLIVDRARFPRYKTCGAGLIGVSRSLLPPRAEQTVEREICEVVFTLRGRAPVRVRRAHPFLAMSNRESLDAALLETARLSGVEVRESTAVRSVEEDAEGVTVTTEAGALRARCVIGADGAGSRLGRYVGVRASVVDLGLEDDRRRESTDADAAVRIDWGPGRGSYGWVFPKAEIDSVGVIEERGAAEQTRAYLAMWLTQTEQQDAQIVHSSGHLTHCRHPDSPLRRGRVLVAGDAAGLLEPWTREGISFALRSGMFAGRAAAAFASSGDESMLDGYAAEVSRELEPEMRAGFLVRGFFERRPRLVHLMLRRSRRVQDFFVGFCDGSRHLSELERHPLLLRVVRRLS